MKNNAIKISESELIKEISNIISEVFSNNSYKNNNSFKIIDYFNLDSIPLEEIKKQYTDLSIEALSSGFGGKFFYYKGKILINEEVSETLSIEDTKNEMKKKFHFKDWQFAVTPGHNETKLIILYPSILKNTKIIKRAMEACGWSFSFKTFTKKNGMLWKAMSFDPMFQKEIGDRIYKISPLYHWTPENNLKEIFANGLLPMSENKLYDYPKRIHLVEGITTKKELFSIGKELYIANKKKNPEYALLEVDVKKLPQDIKFYYDPRYECGVYTNDTIPPFAIKIKLFFNFETNDISNPNEKEC